MSEPFVGEIRIVGFNFPPRGWADCNGQLLAISQNTALFSLLGTYYGGDGRTTFALPDLRDRTALHQGQGPGLTSRVLGESAGQASVTLTSQQMPAHAHNPVATATAGTTPSPVGATWAQIRGQSYAATADAELGPDAVGVTGGSFPHNNLPPYLVLRYVIALQGIYPPRS